jgi:hypothetical protein
MDRAEGGPLVRTAVRVALSVRLAAIQWYRGARATISGTMNMLEPSDMGINLPEPANSSERALLSALTIRDHKKSAAT